MCAIPIDGVGGHGDVECVEDGAVCEACEEVALHDAGVGGGSPVGNKGGGSTALDKDAGRDIEKGREGGRWVTPMPMRLSWREGGVGTGVT